MTASDSQTRLGHGEVAVADPCPRSVSRRHILIALSMLILSAAALSAQILEQANDWIDNRSPLLGGNTQSDPIFGFRVAASVNSLLISAVEYNVEGVRTGAVYQLMGKEGSGLVLDDENRFLVPAGYDELPRQGEQHFGYSVVTGFFRGERRSSCDTADCDDLLDVVVGSPDLSVDGLPAAGAVEILYRDCPLPIINGCDALQYIHQDVSGIFGDLEMDDQFGFAMAVGDFNGDGGDDLIIGIPGEDIGDVVDTGAVAILFGRRGVGLVADGDRFLTMATLETPGLVSPGSAFGASLAVGDFDRDGKDDLAIAANGRYATNGVAVLYQRINLDDIFVDGFESGGVQAWASRQ